MERLTHKQEHKDKRKNKEPMLKIRNKLFDLENIEEELGIALTTLFKAFREGVWCKYTLDIKCAVELCFNDGMYGYNQNQYYFTDYKNNEYWLKDYGKTWALTKEELK